MSDPHSRARDGERKRAVERVDAAYADGLISAVRDLRSQMPPSWVVARQTFRLTPRRRSGSAAPSAAIVVIAVVVLISVAASFMVSLVGGMNPVDDFPGGDPIRGSSRPTGQPTSWR